jgi:hypothetical protein
LLPPGFRQWLSDRWWYQLGKSLTRMVSQPSAVIDALLSDGEGRNDIVEIEKQFGRAVGLLEVHKRYGALRNEVRNAKWKRSEHCNASLVERTPRFGQVDTLGLDGPEPLA